MVTYTFKCENCGVIFEEDRRMGDIAPGACPQCHSAEGVRKLLSPSHVWVPLWLKRHTCWDDVAPFATPTRKMDRAEFMEHKKREAKKSEESEIPIDWV